MIKGTVFCHINLTFKNGDTGKKLLVVLNNQSGSDPFLCCKTTSQKRYDLDREGCYSEKNVFVINQAPFNVKTWIQFDLYSIFEFTSVELLKLKFNEEVKVIGCIATNYINGIVNCYRKSDDISAYHIDLLKK